MSGEILSAGLEGFFPGMKFTNDVPTDIKFTHPSIASVSAIASLRDDKKETFVQGIERLINATSQICKFRAYFIADSVSNEESKSNPDPSTLTIPLYIQSLYTLNSLHSVTGALPLKGTSEHL